ncbi:Hint domain-containing protein [Marinovum sp.]|uniref:Hint domain-containing protein n=1 Tax=Marinovum sp. TaxID=2024839 RepID=UPI002B2678EC|nr:Hint domain-containing protein [Marinovum sp.]
MPSLVIYDWSQYTTSLTQSELETSTHGNDPDQTGTNPYNPDLPTWTGTDFTYNGGTSSVIDILDDDGMFQDGYAETGGAQTLASDVTINGTTYLAGSVVENEFSLVDSSGLEVWVVKIDGVNVGFAYPEGHAPATGSTYNANDTRDGDGADSLDQTTPSEEAYADMACFTAGTRIRTARGEVPVEEISVGDLVWTLDHGFQPVRWVGHSRLGEAALAHNPHLKPVLIPAGVLRSTADLLVSPQHCLLMKAGGQSMLVRAKHLGELDGPVRVARGKRDVAYHHLMFDRHQILLSNGVLSESFYPGPQAMKALSSINRVRILAMLPRLLDAAPEEAYGPTARPVLRRKALDQLARLKRDHPATRSIVFQQGTRQKAFAS